MSVLHRFYCTHYCTLYDDDSAKTTTNVLFYKYHIVLTPSEYKQYVENSTATIIIIFFDVMTILNGIYSTMDNKMHINLQSCISRTLYSCQSCTVPNTRPVHD